ncbi:MAG: hypothetical protein IJU84_06475, partial [Clostridia bacterium]|nr:hypothetical protein [Clostridia bacterium]MBQ9481789.1 hypothetical protein [Clostridia bacterium]
MKKFFSMRSFSKTERREEPIPSGDPIQTQNGFPSSPSPADNGKLADNNSSNSRGAEVMLGILNAHERSAERIFGKKK